MNTIFAADLEAVDQQVVNQCMAVIAAAQREFLEDGKKQRASEDDAPQWTLKDSEEYVLTAKLIRPFYYFPVSVVDDQVRASFGTFQVAIDATNPEHHILVSPSIRRACIDRLKRMVSKYFDESTSVEIDSHILGSDIVEILVSSSVPKSEVSERDVMNNRKVVITRTAIDRVRKAFARLHDWSAVHDIPLTDDEDEVVMIRVDHNNANLEKPVPIIYDDHQSLLAEIGSCELTVSNDDYKPLDPARAEDFLIRLGKKSVNRASVAIPAENFHFSVSTLGTGLYWITATVDVPVDGEVQHPYVPYDVKQEMFMTAISEKQITDALDAIKRNIESAVKKSHTKHGDDAVPEWEVQLDGGRVAHVYYLRAGFNLGVDTEAGFEMMASLGTYHVLVNDDGQDYVPGLKLADEILHKFMERFTKGVAKTGLKYRVFDLEDAIYEVRVNASVLAASA